MTTILYSERMYADDSVERDVFGPDVRVLVRAPAHAGRACRTRIAPRPTG